MVKWYRRRTHAIAALLTSLTAAGCDRANQSDESSDASKTATPAPVERVVFPAELQVDYAPVDKFVSDALSTCVRGDYDAFRLLWSAKQEPLRREEFEQGWQAVTSVRVRAVEKVVLPAADDGPTEPLDTDPGGVAPDVSYVLLARAEFDTRHPVGKRRPTREFVLLILREQGEWRLGRAPAAVRSWIKARVGDDRDEHAPASEDAGR